MRPRLGRLRLRLKVGRSGMSGRPTPGEKRCDSLRWVCSLRSRVARPCRHKMLPQYRRRWCFGRAPSSASAILRTPAVTAHGSSRRAGIVLPQRRLDPTATSCETPSYSSDLTTANSAWRSSDMRRLAKPSRPTASIFGPSTLSICRSSPSTHALRAPRLDPHRPTTLRMSRLASSPRDWGETERRDHPAKASSGWRHSRQAKKVSASQPPPSSSDGRLPAARQTSSGLRW